MLSFAMAAARSQAPMTAAPFREWSAPDGTPWTQFFRTDTGYLLRFPDLADFQVSVDGHTVICSPGPDVTEGTTEHLYRNQVLPLVLSTLGKLVFHASAVELVGGAIAFVAPSGRGKSTLAACFAMDGSRVMSDDGMVVEAAGSGYRILPGHPSIRLWEDSQAALMDSGAIIAPALPFTSKARILADAAIVFCEQARPLRKVYFLGDGSATQIVLRRMTAAEAMVDWIRHSFLLDVQAQPMLASHFDQVARLAEQPIHYHLDFPRHFETLTRVRQAIARHASAEGDAA